MNSIALLLSKAHSLLSRTPPLRRRRLRARVIEPRRGRSRRRRRRTTSIEVSRSAVDTGEQISNWINNNETNYNTLIFTASCKAVNHLRKLERSLFVTFPALILCIVLLRIYKFPSFPRNDEPSFNLCLGLRALALCPSLARLSNAADAADPRRRQLQPPPPPLKSLSLRPCNFLV